jgi:hypothetical protein
LVQIHGSASFVIVTEQYNKNQMEMMRMYCWYYCWYRPYEELRARMLEVVNGTKADE